MNVPLLITENAVLMGTNGRWILVASLLQHVEDFLLREDALPFEHGNQGLQFPDVIERQFFER